MPSAERASTRASFGRRRSNCYGRQVIAVEREQVEAVGEHARCAGSHRETIELLGHPPRGSMAALRAARGAGAIKRGSAPSADNGLTGPIARLPDGTTMLPNFV
jgi:hypothetical protein